MSKIIEESDRPLGLIDNMEDLIKTPYIIKEFGQLKNVAEIVDESTFNKTCDFEKLLVHLISEKKAEISCGIRCIQLKIKNGILYYHDSVVTDVKVLDENNTVLFMTSYECHRSQTKVRREKAYREIDAWMRNRR